MRRHALSGERAVTRGERGVGLDQLLVKRPEFGFARMRGGQCGRNMRQHHAGSGELVHVDFPKGWRSCFPGPCYQAPFRCSVHRLAATQVSREEWHQVLREPLVDAVDMISVVDLQIVCDRIGVEQGVQLCDRQAADPADLRDLLFRVHDVEARDGLDRVALPERRVARPSARGLRARACRRPAAGRCQRFPPGDQAAAKPAWPWWGNPRQRSRRRFAPAALNVFDRAAEWAPGTRLMM